MQAQRSWSREEALYPHLEALSLRRKPSAKDIRRVETLTHATGFFSEEEVSIALELLGEYLAKGAASGYQFLFAETPSELVGYACFGRIPCTQASYDLYWLVVAPAVQGCGIGKALLAAAEAAIAAEGGKRVYIDTSGKAKYQSTRRFYQGAGYREVSLLEDFYAASDPKVVYLKILGSS
ncbi:MAG: GNAT family N-acetyltransferase [Gammaproteobacteria bacterium]